MNRTLRRVVTTQPPETPVALALDYERSGGWPNRAEYHRFWDSARVPAHLREYHTPDPRAVFGDDDDRLKFEREVAEWKAARIAWLRSQV